MRITEHWHFLNKRRMMQASLMAFLLKFMKNPFTLIIAIMVLYIAFALYIDVGKLSKTAVRIDYVR